MFTESCRFAVAIVLKTRAMRIGPKKPARVPLGMGPATMVVVRCVLALGKRQIADRRDVLSFTAAPYPGSRGQGPDCSCEVFPRSHLF